MSPPVTLSGLRAPSPVLSPIALDRKFQSTVASPQRVIQSDAERQQSDAERQPQSQKPRSLNQGPHTAIRSRADTCEMYQMTTSAFCTLLLLSYMEGTLPGDPGGAG